MNNLQIYVLVTVAKNEGSNLPLLIQSVIKQTIKPILWVIVNDGSTDNTQDILTKTNEKYKWIHIIRLEEGKRDVGFHLSSMMKNAFDFTVGLCGRKGINYEYLGNIDGDISIEPAFFEKLIKEFEKDPNLGIAGSGTCYLKKNRIIQPQLNPDEPSGGDILIKRKCFEDCGGILVSCCWDSVLKVKARLRGYKTRRFESIKAFESRDFGEIEGWRRYIHKGRSDYHLNNSLIYVIFKSISLLFKYPYFIGFMYSLGYFKALIRRENQIDDVEIKNYYRTKWKILLKYRLKT